MKFALHGMVTKYNTIASDIRIAADTEYDGVELHTDKLWAYIQSGGTASHLKELCKHYSLVPVAIDIIGDVESTDTDTKKRVTQETRILSEFAQNISTTHAPPTIQLNGFEYLSDRSLEDNIEITATHIQHIAKIGAEYGVKFQYEGAAWTPIHTLKDCLSLVKAVGMPNFGLAIDFWHLWASRGAEPQDVAFLDKDIIFGVHCCGGTRPPLAEDGSIAWQEEVWFRDYFPRDSTMKDFSQMDTRLHAHEVRTTEEFLPVQEWVDAIYATGYDQWVSGEFLGHILWQGDNQSNAHIMREQLMHYFNR